MELFDVYKRIDLDIVKGEGRYVWDDKGDRYLDLFGGHAVISIGHSHPHYIKQVTKQLNELGFYSNSVKLSIQERLAHKLGTISGKEDYQLFLCNSGAEANENAVKVASFANGRKKIITFTGAFHGRTSLAFALTDNPSIVAPVNATDNIIFLPHNDIKALEEAFTLFKDEISSVIIEGIQGVGGMRGKGLMIGIELSDRHKELRANLITKQRILTGHAGQKVIRLLPALSITTEEADIFLTAIEKELR